MVFGYFTYVDFLLLLNFIAHTDHFSIFISDFDNSGKEYSLGTLVMKDCWRSCLNAA